ncbi:hypothetical protein NM208_g14224 [Fusarium decemcellulare]|uniref:Uncharacterized protein n=1 Tax=Fusarium decemcellulare TaxID=57161 RepID=A0ACC1RIP3_9HYPO|nr:hypothetical protein NM208_g14224 [Fusarium decemcellulare]
MLRNFSLMLRDPDRQPTVPRKFPRDGDPGNGFSIFVQYLPTHHNNNIRTICPDLPELPAFLDPTQRSPAEATVTWYMLVYAASPAFQGDEKPDFYQAGSRRGAVLGVLYINSSPRSFQESQIVALAVPGPSANAQATPFDLETI